MNRCLLFCALVVSPFLRLLAVEVSDAAGLAAALRGSEPITLTEDLNLAGWTPVDFEGTLDGARHSIIGLTGPLFANLSGTVSNLTIDGSSGGGNTTITLADRTDFGLLALTTTAARVENSNVKGYSIVNAQSSNKSLPQNSIGFFVACAYDGSVFVNDVTLEGCSASLGGDLAFGGIAGNVKRSASYSGTDVISFSRCVNNADITTTKGASGAGNGAVGGILGRDSVGGVSANPCTLTFSDCTNIGSWNAAGQVGNSVFGGIIGQYAGGSSSTRYNTLRLISCVNHGDMSTASGASCNNMRLGGLLGMGGRYADNIEIDKCLNDGNITVLGSGVGGNTHGGLIGYIYDMSKYARLTVRNSVNRGNISIAIAASKSNSVGGMMGHCSLNRNYEGVEITVENCSFGGEFNAQITGPLIAQLGSSTTISPTLKVSIDNCWFLQSGALVDTAELIGDNYSETNIEFHADGADVDENAALALVAASNDDYVAWQVSSKSGHPEPVLGATLYTVVFSDYDGPLLDMRQVEEGQAAVAPADPTRTGYAFAGWDPSDFSNVTGNMTIVATYEQSANFRTVTFVDYDGRELVQLALESGSAVGDQAPQPMRTGYQLVGWLRDGRSYDLAAPVTEDFTLTAEYQINVYDVVFFDWEDNQLGETQKVAYLSAAVAPALPALPEGKSFWKWAPDFSSVTEDLEVRAEICDSVQTIASAEDFARKINAQTPSVVTFRLEGDIVLENWESVDFSASLDGQGHVISGLSKPLFNAVRGATIENLVISDSALNTTETEEYIGLVARTAGDGATIRNVTTTADCSIGAGINVAAGGLVGVMINTATYEGEMSSWIEDCTNRAAVTKTATDSNSRGSLAGIVGRIEAQGLVGQPYVTNGVLRCANFGPITCAFNGGRLAGLVGKVLTQNDKALIAILDSGNYTNITGVTTYGSDPYKKLYGGGVVATVGTACMTVLIDGCVNRGAVSVGFEPEGQADNLDKTAAGIVAHVESLQKYGELTIRNTANYGDVEGENAAGIVGTFGASGNFAYTKGILQNCASYGAVSGRTRAALAVGGWSKPSVSFTRRLENCFFCADGEGNLPVVGGTEEGFVLADVITNADEGYEETAAKRTLDLSAGENDWFRWRISPLGESSAPQMIRFVGAGRSLVIVIR